MLACLLGRSISSLARAFGSLLDSRICFAVFSTLPSSQRMLEQTPSSGHVFSVQAKVGNLIELW